MGKHGLKYLVDSLLFIDVCAVAVIGLIMGFVVPGRQGVGGEKYFLWLHRHDWGDIHLYLSLIMLGLLVLHLFLNWTWISSSSKSFFGERWKQVVMAFFAGSLIVLFAGWLIKIL
jgi:hypothetical protein